MSFFKSKKNRNRKTSGGGFLTYSDAYQLIKDNIDEAAEFYELEPAIVIEVLLNPADLPKKNTPDGKGKMPDYEKLGTIKARFVESQGKEDSIEGYVKPLSSHMVSYPLIGEVVNIAKHGKQMYYYQPLNLGNNVNMNIASGETTDSKITAYTTEHNRTLLGEYGDIVFNGRFGQGIKFGSDPFYQYPDIKITNRQSVPPQKAKDAHYPHLQNINADGSSIFITSGPAREVDVLIPASQTATTPDVLDGDMITLNSDKLVFNSKQTDIHMFAKRNLNLSANEEINLELGLNAFGGRITLGDADSTNPIALGNQLEDLFEKLLSTISSFSNTVSNATGVVEVGDAAKTMLKDIEKIETDVLPTILSDTVYVTENSTDEITSVNDVEADVEPIFRTSGFRG
jgi:hypothetical protein